MNPKRTAVLFIGAQIAAAAIFASVGATGGLHGVAYADVSSWRYDRTPACTDDQGNVVAVAPCTIMVNPDGSSDVYTGELGECAYEDGNPDGTPCLWTDPDTGNRYFVTSLEYRR